MWPWVAGGRETELLSLSKEDERHMKDGAAGEEKKRSEGRRETMGDAEGGEGEKEQECGKINARGREQVRSQGERIKTYQGSE